MNSQSTSEKSEQTELVGGGDVKAYDQEEPVNLYGGDEHDETKNAVGGGRKRRQQQRKTKRRQQQKRRQQKTQKGKQQKSKKQSRKNKKGGKGKGSGIETAAVPLALLAAQQYIANRLGKTKKSRRVTRKR